MSTETEESVERSFVLSDRQLSLDFQEKYLEFSRNIKPLISAVESLLEYFPKELYNEVRSFNDHMVRCVALCKTEEEVAAQLRKAQSHLTRITLDCYKCLIIGYRDLIEKFQRETKYVDLTTIDNGQFSGKYHKMYRDAVNKVRIAKIAETKNPDARYDLYAEAYLAYLDLYEFTVDNTASVNWARAKTYFRKAFSALGWVLTLVLGAILTNNNTTIVQTITSFFTRQ